MKQTHLVIKNFCKKLPFAKKGWRRVKEVNLFVQSKLIKAIIWSSRLMGTEFNLRNIINQYYDDFYLRLDFSKDISKILKGKLICLDVGSRGGCLEIVKKYAKFMEIIMCEPEKSEAERLSKEGHRVIESVLSKKSGELTFFESRMPEASSVYKPQGPFLDFYNSDPGYFSLYDVIRSTRLECSTISAELAKLEIEKLDFLKVDTQGSELDILMGLGNYQPLLMQIEIEYLPLYHGIPTAYQVCQYLFELGYIPFSLASHHDRVLCPTWGDGFFMPNWVDPKGLELIRSREEKFIALMLMFGQVDMLKFIHEKIRLRNAGFIKSL